MMTLIVSSLYLILPAYVANMAPVIAAKLRLPYGRPINRELFGDHKTYRGFYAAFLGALLAILLQRAFQEQMLFETARLIDYLAVNPFVLAFAFGFGALLGDLVKSYFKRRLKRPSGSPWFPFDQLDFILGSLLFLLPFYQPGWGSVVVLLLLTPILHFLTNVAAYLLGLKKVWW